MDHDAHLSRRELLVRAGAASGLAVAGGLLAMPAVAGADDTGIIFKNGGDIDGFAPDKWTGVANESKTGGVRSYAVQDSTNVERFGEQSMRFETKWNNENTYDRDPDNRFHSEVFLTDDLVGRDGVSRWYGWSTYLPSSVWQNDSKRVIFLQFHISDGGGDTANSPVAFMHIQNGNFYWQNRPELRAAGRDGDTDPGRYLGAVAKDQWVDWVLRVTWRSGTTGSYDIWRNGNRFKNGSGGYPLYSGKTYFADGDYLRLFTGCYAAFWVPPFTTARPTNDRRVIYQDQYRIGDSTATYNSVKPQP